MEDEAGCIKGLTVRRIAADTSAPSSYKPLQPSHRERVRIIDSTQVELGLLDPDLWETEDFQNLLLWRSQSIPSGALTSTFTLTADVSISSRFDFEGSAQTLEVADCLNCQAHLLSDDAIGTFDTELHYAKWGDLFVYPVLRINRSSADLNSKRSVLRNGAMVTVGSNFLAGIIVSIFNAGTSYGVAPIRSVIEWHALRFRRPMVTEQIWRVARVDLADPTDRREPPSVAQQATAHPHFLDLVGS